MVDYPRLPHVESGSEGEGGSASRQNGRALEVKSKRRYMSENESSEDSDEEVGELSRLLGGFGGKSNKNSSKDSDKKSDRESVKKSDKESGKKSNKNSGKNSDESDEMSGGSDDMSDNAQDLRRAKGIIQRLGLNSNKGPGEESGKKSDKERDRNSDNPSKKNSKGSEHERSQKSRKEMGTPREGDQSDDATEQEGTSSGKTTKRNATNGKQTREEESEEDESSGEHTKATRYTKEQREEVTRVRKCSRKDYYTILGLEENCSGIEVKKAYRKLSLLTHPDKNKYKDAGKAFTMVSIAYQVLGNSSQRATYDRNQKAYKLRGELDPIKLWDEEFAENASGTDSGSESDGDDSEEEKEMEPGTKWLDIYEKATPLVRKLLTNRHNSSNISKIESLNETIEELNKEYNRQAEEYNRTAEAKGRKLKRYIKEDASSFFININVLKSIGMQARAAVESLEKDPNDKQAKELQEKTKKQFEKTIRINSYPQEWLDCLPWSGKDNGKRRAEPASSKEKGKGKGREKPSSSRQKDGENDTDMPDVGPSSKKKGKGKGREGPSSSKQKDGESDTEMSDVGPSSKKKGKGKGREGPSYSKQNGGESDVDLTDVVNTRRRKWKPGETRKGERILGWRPFYKTDRKKKEQLYNGCQFVIEKKGHPNPIALVSGEDVGRRVVDAYRDLPEEEQNDIRYSEKRYTYEDADRFDTLLGFACKPFNTKTEGSSAYYPNGYALYSFTDGSEDLVSRECMRQVFGKKDADNEIADFYEDIGETPPWLIEPKMLLKPKKKLLTSGSEVKRRSKSRRHADSDDESDSDSDSSSIFVSAKKKGKRYVRDDESSDDDNSSGDDSGDGRKQSRMPRTKRNSKMKKTKPMGSDNQSDIFVGIMQKFMKQMAEENRRQAEDMSKKFEEVLSRIPVSGAA